jgi:hypothetical protein
MSWGSPDRPNGERGISTVAGTGLIVAIVVVLSVTTIALFSSLSQAELGKTDPQNIGQYALEVESDGGDTLVIRPKATADLGEDTDVYLNGTMIIDNVNAATTGTVFSAPGVKCRGDATWD